MTEHPADEGVDADAQRLLRLLGKGECAIEPSSKPDRCIVTPTDGPPVSIPVDVVSRLGSGGLVEITRSGRIRLAGRRSQGRNLAAADRYGARGKERVLTQTTLKEETGPRQVVMNISESPLGLLYRRKDKSGKPFLATEEFGAGERLRADFTRGQMLPRLGANWQASVASGRRDGGRGSVADLTDAALGARNRVESALAAVGPELCGVLVDVCCFLKGLEMVEMERQWPARSAKIVLRTALAALARHYRPKGFAGGTAARPKIVHWGAEDYRPSLPTGIRDDRS